MKKVVSVVLAASLLVGGVLYALPKSDPSLTKPAVAAAKAWLHTVDTGDYVGSWTDAASLFQEAVPQDQWTKQIKGVRQPLGAVVSRELIGAKHTTALPGAPDGEYVIIQFKTSFAGKKSAVETITPMLDGTRGWRVSGYYIK